VEARVVWRGQPVRVEAVLVDTGSDSTCFDADVLRPLGLLPGPDETLQVVHGVGGVETVYSGILDSLSIGDLHVGPIRVDVGRMGYGFGIDAVLGMDFLDRAGAVIDLPARQVRFASASPDCGTR
jgi:predicted aspartyl protease